MYQGLLVCLLATLRYIIEVHQLLSSACKQLSPCFARTASKGIRPVAPKCIALVLNDSELIADDLERLGRVLDWSVSLLLQPDSPCERKRIPLLPWRCRCAKAGLQHAIVYSGQGS